MQRADECGRGAVPANTRPRMAGFEATTGVQRHLEGASWGGICLAKNQGVIAADSLLAVSICALQLV